MTAVVSQAGVLDVAARLGAAGSRTTSRANSSAATSRTPGSRSPIERLPLGVPALLVHGGRDDIVPVEISERFAARAGATLVVEPEEDHFGHLDPENPMWQAVVQWL